MKPQTPMQMFAFRVNRRELKNISRAAKARNMTRSQFIRYALLMSMEKMKENRDV